MLHEGHIVSVAEQRWSADRFSPFERNALDAYDADVEALKAKCREAQEIAERLKQSSNHGPSLEREGLDMDDCVHLLTVMGHGLYWKAEDAL